MLNIANPRIYTNSQGQTYPGVSDVAHYSYTRNGHTTPAGRLETFNGDVANDAVPSAAAEVLSRAGWDGSPLSAQDVEDLIRFSDFNGHSFSYNINDAYFALWHDRGETGSVTPPPPPAAGAVQGSELYESYHEVSAKYPKGTTIWRATGAQETAWGGINALHNQATADDVPWSAEQETLAKAGLIHFNDAMHAAFQEGRDFLFGTEAEQCQLACDDTWKAVHALRKAAKAAKQDGWQLVAGDPRKPIFQYSRFNRIAWTILVNLTTAAGLYGLHGEKTSTGQRDASYVDPYMNWESQDPLNVPTGGGGINIPGNAGFGSALTR